MFKIQKFTDNQIEAISKTIADFTTGSQITDLLRQISIDDPNTKFTKWRRINYWLKHIQQSQGNPHGILKFIQVVMEPSRFIDAQDSFDSLRANLQKVLLLNGSESDSSGQLLPTKKAETLDEAHQRANQLKKKLSQRYIHPNVLKFCEPEYLQQNYFHAVFEAVKSILERLRELTGLNEDGVKLVAQIFDRNRPKLSFNKFETTSERNELMGFRAIIIGLVQMVRNPHAHEAKINWAVNERDALDVLTMVSFVHRRLDESFKTYF